MGLDDVEVMLGIEEEFGIVFPDLMPWSKDVTVGEICSIVQVVLNKKNEFWDIARRFYVLRRAICAETSVEKRSIRPSARLLDLLPLEEWRRHRNAITGRIDIEKYSFPGEPLGMSLVRLIICDVLMILVCIYLLRMTVFSVAVVLAVISIPIIGISAWSKYASQPFPEKILTVGDWARSMCPKLKEVALDNVSSSTEETQARVIDVIARELNIPKNEVTLDSRLYGELGAG